MVDPNTATHSLRTNPLGKSLSLLLFISYLAIPPSALCGCSRES